MRRKTMDKLKMRSENLVDENIKKLAQIDTITNQIFSKTFISTNDRIIPTKSQQNYWNNRTNIQYLNCGHFPFYKYKMDDLL